MREANYDQKEAISKNSSPVDSIDDGDECCCACFFSLFSTKKSEERPILNEVSDDQLIRIAGIM